MSRLPIPLDLRRRIRRRARNRCEFCHYPQAACYSPFHIDHFIPESRGGASQFDNLVFACPHCNGSKHARTHAIDPVTGQTVPLFNPRRDKWDQHFRWSANALRIIGITPSARATLKALRMNRRGVSVIRGMLVELGLHP